MRNTPVERLLYISLAVVLVGALIGLAVTVVSNRGLQSQVKTLQQQTSDRAQTGDEIRSAVDQIKADQDQNTQYLICIAKALSTGQGTSDSAGCKVQPNS